MDFQITPNDLFFEWSDEEKENVDFEKSERKYLDGCRSIIKDFCSELDHNIFDIENIEIEEHDFQQHISIYFYDMYKNQVYCNKETDELEYMLRNYFESGNWIEEVGE